MTRYWLYDIDGAYAGSWQSLDELGEYVKYQRHQESIPRPKVDGQRKIRFTGMIRIEAHIMIRKSYYVNAI